ncbi:hypothetical protein Mp_5g01280 [Marchantia polymorpha subsp. ruderalis]|uniref:Uncharacterized protein n=2 Tax=Marchantia polymorpha TaxID=3197 RepID=A0AAF6BDR4_MARPO|nr:hypothetical protein MARPO_0100s0002 [Marchantia polymorpha]BBN10148.1 hypothetical protein Mp_5g01280 [Marchantia polymorpha subsp. ruderalis]|eukprot:PTQ32287.1 hypothetical protein MARPO_0100s0002 [Marchantia polymorpha]
MRAQEAQEKKHFHLFCIELLAQSRIYDIKQAFPIQLLPDPIHKESLLDRPLEKVGRSSTSNLQSHGPEGVHIRLVGEFPRACYLGGYVTEGPGNLSGGRIPRMIRHPSQSKVPQHGVEVLIQHDIAGLEVPMNHLLPPALVQVI